MAALSDALNPRVEVACAFGPPGTHAYPCIAIGDAGLIT